jgi:hypothetical protein
MAATMGGEYDSNVQYVYIPRKKPKVQVKECNSLKEIEKVFKSLDFEEIESHFKTNEDDVEPYLVCATSLDTFEAFVGDGSRKMHPELRFLEFKDSKVYIIEWPALLHEAVIDTFKARFLQASGNMNEIGKKGSFTAHRNGDHSKEADATFGPFEDTPNRNNPPAGISVGSWVTLVAEIAVSQSWASLKRAALWWANYPGVEYIICIKISPRTHTWRYCMYSIENQGVLPDPRFDKNFRGDIIAGQHTITLSARRILGIPNHLPLPAGVTPNIDVDFRDILMDTKRTSRTWFF